VVAAEPFERADASRSYERVLDPSSRGDIVDVTAFER
jgi:hypothetical protein